MPRIRTAQIKDLPTKSLITDKIIGHGRINEDGSLWSYQSQLLKIYTTAWEGAQFASKLILIHNENSANIACLITGYTPVDYNRHILFNVHARDTNSLKIGMYTSTQVASTTGFYFFLVKYF